MGDARIGGLIRSAIESGGREQLGAILAAIESTGGFSTLRVRAGRGRTGDCRPCALPETPFRTGLAALAASPSNASMSESGIGV